jgi:UDP-glucose 4-epimerase
MKRKIFILGSNGFIGNWLLRRFSALSKKDCIKGFSSGDCNLLSWKSVKKAFAGCGRRDVVIMCSAISRIRDNSFSAMQKNIQMAYHLAEAFRLRSVDQLIFLSTVDVYGCTTRPDIKDRDCISETTALHPDDFYSLSKVTSEFLLRTRMKELGIPLAVLRLPGVYGPRDNGQSLIGSFITQAKTKKVLSVYGAGDILRNYVYVDDIFQVIHLIVRKKINKTLNLVSPKSYAILEIAQIIQRQMGKEICIQFKKVDSKNEKRSRSIICNSRELNKIFPGIRMRDLKEGVRVYLQDLKYT